MNTVQVIIESAGLQLPGDLTIPASAHGLVIFAHGSDSSRHSPRNQYVAGILNRAGLGTLLFDLLTHSEAADRQNVFDIPLLADRLTATRDWAGDRFGPVGYFGASTGGAAALWSAGDTASATGAAGAGGVDGGSAAVGTAAVVSRGGRVDLAGPRLADVSAPTLLIVGALDTEVLEFNRSAQRELRCVNHLEVIPGATHLFAEPGTLEQVAVLARDWFHRELADH